MRQPLHKTAPPRYVTLHALHDLNGKRWGNQRKFASLPLSTKNNQPSTASVERSRTRESRPQQSSSGVPPLSPCAVGFLGLKARDVKAWAGASLASAGPGLDPPLRSQGLKGRHHPAPGLPPASFPSFASVEVSPVNVSVPHKRIFYRPIARTGAKSAAWPENSVWRCGGQTIICAYAGATPLRRHRYSPRSSRYKCPRTFGQGRSSPLALKAQQNLAQGKPAPCGCRPGFAAPKMILLLPSDGRRWPKAG
jgi:hypothetical protein